MRRRSVAADSSQPSASPARPEQARQLGQRLVLEHHEGVGVGALDGAVGEAGGEHVGVEAALERAPRQEQAVEPGEVTLLPALEGDHPGVDAVTLGPLRPERPGAAQGPLGDDRLGGLGLARLVRQLGAVHPAVGVGAVEQAEQAPGRGVAELRVVEQGDRRLARVVVEEPERIVARAEPVAGGRGALAGGSGAGEHPRRRPAERHRREPRVLEAEVRRADAVPCPAPERRPQGREVGDVARGRRPLALSRRASCGRRAPARRGLSGAARLAHLPLGGGVNPGVAPGVGTGGGGGAFASSSSTLKSSTEPPGMPARGWPFSP